MPCDSIQQNRVKLAANIDPALLAKALSALGFAAGEYFHEINREQVTLRGAKGQGVTQANIAQAYGAEVVKATAKKMGWQIKQTAPFKFAVTKGGF